MKEYDESQQWSLQNQNNIYGTIARLPLSRTGSESSFMRMDPVIMDIEIGMDDWGH